MNFSETDILNLRKVKIRFLTFLVFIIIISIFLDIRLMNDAYSRGYNDGLEINAIEFDFQAGSIKTNESFWNQSFYFVWNNHSTPPEYHNDSFIFWITIYGHQKFNQSAAKYQVKFNKDVMLIISFDVGIVISQRSTGEVGLLFTLSNYASITTYALGSMLIYFYCHGAVSYYDYLALSLFIEVSPYGGTL